MRRSLSAVLLAAALFVALTLVLTWPLILHLGSVVPNDLGDPLLNTWLLAWNARVPPLTARWWDAPQFFPAHGVMAFSEHLLGLTIISTPVIVATGSALAGYNAAFFLSFPLCALSAYYLTFTITRRHDSAVVAGLAFAFAPYRMAQFAHVQVMSPYWAPLALAALHRYFDRHGSRWLVLFAVAWLMQALTCGYYLFYLSVLIGLWLVWFVVGRERWADLARVLAAWAVATVALVPVLHGYWTIQHAQGFHRGLDEIKAFSADIASVLKAPDNIWAWRWLNVFDRPESALFPGATLVVLLAVAVLIGVPATETARRRVRATRMLLVGAAAGVAMALSVAVFGSWKIQAGGLRLFSLSSANTPLVIVTALLLAAAVTHPGFRALWRRRSPFAFYLLAAVVMWLLSLGPDPTFMNVPIRARAPYSWLMLLPGMDGVRVPARFWMLAILCLSVAAGLAVRHLVTRWPGRSTLFPALACIGILADGWPRPLALQVPPDARPNRTNADLRLELPVDAWHDLAVLYRSIDHRRPLVNGYSGYYPRHYRILQYLFEQHDPAVLTQLSAWGTIEVVVDQREDPSGVWRAFAGAHPHAQLVYRDEHYTTYRIAGAPASIVLPRPAGLRLPIAGMTAYQRAAPVRAMVDNDLATRWDAGRPQQPGDDLTVDLGQPRDVTGAEMLLGEYVDDFPRQLRIELSIDGQAWIEVWRGGSALPALLAAIEDPLSVAVPFPFPSRRARYVRFTQTAVEPVNYWSIAELRILGR